MPKKKKKRHFKIKSQPKLWCFLTGIQLRDSSGADTRARESYAEKSVD